jgi:hypothetical protein
MILCEQLLTQRNRSVARRASRFQVGRLVAEPGELLQRHDQVRVHVLGIALAHRARSLEAGVRLGVLAKILMREAEHPEACGDRQVVLVPLENLQGVRGGVPGKTRVPCAKLSHSAVVECTSDQTVLRTVPFDAYLHDAPEVLERGGMVTRFQKHNRETIERLGDLGVVCGKQAFANLQSLLVPRPGPDVVANLIEHQAQTIERESDLQLVRRGRRLVDLDCAVVASNGRLVVTTDAVDDCNVRVTRAHALVVRSVRVFEDPERACASLQCLRELLLRQVQIREVAQAARQSGIVWCPMILADSQRLVRKLPHLLVRSVSPQGLDEHVESVSHASRLRICGCPGFVEKHTRRPLCLVVLPLLQELVDDFEARRMLECPTGIRVLLRGRAWCHCETQTHDRRGLQRCVAARA